MALDADSATEADLQKILEGRRARLRRELAAVEQLLACLSGQMSDAPSGVAEAGSNAAYASLKPQEASLRLLRDYPDKKWRASAAAKKLKKLGVKSESKTFPSLVSAALKRLAERGMALREMDGKRPIYSLKRREAAGPPAVSQSE